jgi:hypothetical protein
MGFSEKSRKRRFFLIFSGIRQKLSGEVKYFGHWSLVTGHWSLVTGHWYLSLLLATSPGG